MIRSDMRPAPTERHHEMDANADGGGTPMSQQDAGDCHGHEMHLQKFVRLIGCHDPDAGKHHAVHPLQ